MISLYHYKQFIYYYPNSYCFIYWKPVFATVNPKLSGIIVSLGFKVKKNQYQAMYKNHLGTTSEELHSMVWMLYLPCGPPRDDGCLQ